MTPPLAPLARRAFADARVAHRLASRLLFAAYAYVQPVGYRHTYPTWPTGSRSPAASATTRRCGCSTASRTTSSTVGGYTAWRVGGIAGDRRRGLGAAGRRPGAARRGGRGPARAGARGAVGRAPVTFAAALGAIARRRRAAVAGDARRARRRRPARRRLGLPRAGDGRRSRRVRRRRRAGEPARADPRLALELGDGACSSWPVPAAGHRRHVGGLGWLRWPTPLGWAEELRPFTGARPAGAAPAARRERPAAAGRRRASPRAATSARGLLPARDSARPAAAPALLADGAGAARASAAACSPGLVGIGRLRVHPRRRSRRASPPATSRRASQERLAKLGGGSIVTPAGVLGFYFLFFVLAISLFACARSARRATRRPTSSSRRCWRSRSAAPLARRPAAAGARPSAVALLVAGFFAWAGAAAAGRRHRSRRAARGRRSTACRSRSCSSGSAALAYAVVPAREPGIAYGLVTVAFLWQLVRLAARRAEAGSST